jgi:hypothetical protein
MAMRKSYTGHANVRNIGRFATIREGLSVGRHFLTCELLKKTSDPGGGTEFRLIGVMRYVVVHGRADPQFVAFDLAKVQDHDVCALTQ